MYIEKKIRQKKSVLPKQAARKIPKYVWKGEIGKLSLISKVTRALLLSTARTGWNLITEKDLMKQYKKIPETYSKNLENREFLCCQ